MLSAFYSAEFFRKFWLEIKHPFLRSISEHLAQPFGLVPKVGKYRKFRKYRVPFEGFLGSSPRPGQTQPLNGIHFHMKWHSISPVYLF